MSRCSCSTMRSRQASTLDPEISFGVIRVFRLFCALFDREGDHEQTEYTESPHLNLPAKLIASNGA